jgi:hypothetical protein
MKGSLSQTDLYSVRRPEKNDVTPDTTVERLYCTVWSSSIHVADNLSACQLLYGATSLLADIRSMRGRCIPLARGTSPLLHVHARFLPHIPRIMPIYLYQHRPSQRASLASSGLSVTRPVYPPNSPQRRAARPVVLPSVWQRGDAHRLGHIAGARVTTLRKNLSDQPVSNLKVVLARVEGPTNESLTDNVPEVSTPQSNPQHYFPFFFTTRLS